MIDDLTREQAIAWITLLGWKPMDIGGKLRDRTLDDHMSRLSPYLFGPPQYERRGRVAMMWTDVGKPVTVWGTWTDAYAPCPWDAFHDNELIALLRCVLEGRHD
jgi:hypothetical protein